jgi:protein-tyrosine-phosphatase
MPALFSFLQPVGKYMNVHTSEIGGRGIRIIRRTQWNVGAKVLSQAKRSVMREEFNLDMAGQYPKPISKYVGEHFDYVIAVCNEAVEACPIFPGDPEHIHWFYDDPAAAQGAEAQQYHAFETVARQMMVRLRTWLELPAISNRVKANPLARVK